MVFVGQSPFDADRRDRVVCHTGPQGTAPGDIRNMSLRDLGGMITDRGTK